MYESTNVRNPDRIGAGCECSFQRQSASAGVLGETALPRLDPVPRSRDADACEGLAEFGVPIKTDGGIVPGPADFVGIFAVIGFGWEIDEKDFILGDGFEAVEDSWGDMDENSVVFPDDNAVSFPMGGAFGAGVVECDFGHAVNDGHAVGLLFVGVPGFDHSWVDGAEVGLAEADEVGVVLAEDFHDAPAIVAVLGEG